jgi:hypothetical protein
MREPAVTLGCHEASLVVIGIVLLYFDPCTAAPVAMATTRLAPAIALALSPTPIIRHDAKPQGMLLPGLTTDAPAVAFIVTHDCG